MKTLLTIMILLVSTLAFSQGKIILTPAVDYNIDTKKPSGSLFLGVSGVGGSSLELGGNYKEDFVSGVLSGTVYPFSFGLGFNAKALYQHGDFYGAEDIGRLEDGRPCPYLPNTREESEQNKLFGSVGAVIKVSNLRLYGDLVLNDYRAEKWNVETGKGNPFGHETIKVGLAYVLALKKY